MLETNASEARQNIYGLLKSHEIVEIHHKTGDSILMPKEEYLNLRRDALLYRVQQKLAQEPRISEAEVDAMLAKVLGVTSKP